MRRNQLVRAIKRDSARALAAALLFACLAVAIRPVGVFLSGVLLLAPRLPSTGWSPRIQRLAVAAAPVVVLAILMLTRQELTAHRADLTWIEGSWPWQRAHLGLGPERLPRWLAMNAAVVTGVLGVALAPLALGSLSRENVRAALPGALAVAPVLSGEFFQREWVPAPLDPTFTWSLRELGATERLVPPWPPPAMLLGWALAATPVTAVLLALALAPLVRRRPLGEARSLAWGALGYFVLATALWLFYDRYVLPLVVLVTALRLGTVEIRRPRLAVAGVAMLAVVSGVGTWDHLQYSHALWDAVGWARRAGIAERELDGGYVVNGWLQYAHPEHAARAPDGDVLVPWVKRHRQPRPRRGSRAARGGLLADPRALGPHPCHRSDARGIRSALSLRHARPNTPSAGPWSRYHRLASCQPRPMATSRSTSSAFATE